MDSANITLKETPAVSERKFSTRKLIKWLLILLVLGAATIFGYRYWRYSQLYVSTDNAYINANLVEVAAQVSGPVMTVYVKDNQPVRQGDKLFDIDPATFQVAVARARAQLELAQQQVLQLSAAVSAANAQVAQRQAELQNARSNYERTRQLVARNFVSPQAGETARTQLDTATAALKAAQASLEQAKSALGAPGENNATVQAAKAALAQAELDLERTHVVSPTSGKVANLTLRPGNTVQPGVPIFAIISDNEYWADANFKETELERVRPGEAATITVDMYPHHPFRGVVESISGGSGTAFSLLPPQNATGNWVKVTQRVPVRVRFTNTDPNFPLRVGTTATVEVQLAQQQ